MSATMELARFVASKRFADLPPAAVEKAKQCLLDTLGIMIAASGFHYGEKVVPFCARNGEPGTCTLIGSRKKIGPAMASFAHGTLVEILRTQDGVRFGGIHPCSTVIPAALALGEQSSCSGKDLITAIILGYEVARRVTVDEDSSFTQIYPEKTCTAIAVHLKDGTTMTKFVEIPKGDPRNPLLPEEITAKFVRMTKGLLSSPNQKKLVQSVGRLEKMKDITSLTRLLSPMGAKAMGVKIQA